MTYADHPDVIWDEIDEPAPVVAAPAAHHQAGPTEAHDAGYTPCRCWRCRGGASVHERAVLDRALGRHLLRMTYQEREDWLGRWVMNPKHTATDVAVLRRWVAIEAGQHLPQPVYLQERA